VQFVDKIEHLFAQLQSEDKYKSV